ncbi:MAG: nucleotide exchange factor GrpE [Ignavibacteria bacterium GWA2_55_11]|nr:MAG: nucleotide exchange factor GrpE [Ignavibacteria bacterium GWA2_55_11]OGU70439.1 MAG: nucleotide exchange factor GrpE [Ignavibacteria bacterium RIFCSPLOWO2_02_FULL_55_14]OGU72560.1 MAG: nucleotide exchange factor GrpE [Ignavibacteria bacterium RIFCSPLOWO2_12_FULL_56_21]HAV22185.1 nucleotide exchange factor GrpE [Bacteroidota bacterium]
MAESVDTNDTPQKPGQNAPQQEPVPVAATPQPPAEEPTLEQQLAQVKDLFLRKAAEFENYKKRVEQESATVFRMANEGLVLSILPIVDDIERSLKAVRDRPDNDPFRRGLELIHQKLQKVLEMQGVRPLEPVKEFSVDFHDALMQVPRHDVPPHTIIEEVERGYTMNGKVIRHAKVVVSAAPQADESPTSVDDDHTETGRS